MADLMETVEDFMEDINPFNGKGGKVDKKKLFAVACVGVGAVALFLWARGNDADELGTAYVASGYDGYPMMGGESDQAGYYEDLMTEQENIYNSELEKVTNEFNTSLKEQEDYYNNLLGQVSGQYESEIESLRGQFDSQYEEMMMQALLQQQMQEEAEKQYTLDHMSYNSELYNSTDNWGLKKYLAEQNQELGASIGATRDSLGRWYDENGNRLYFTTQEASAQELAKSYTTIDTSVDYAGVAQRLMQQGYAGNSKEVSQAIINRAAKINSMNSQGYTHYATTYDKNVDYAAAIQVAKAQGASQDVINTLTMQRNAKLADMGQANSSGFTSSYKTATGGFTPPSKNATSVTTTDNGNGTVTIRETFANGGSFTQTIKK